MKMRLNQEKCIGCYACYVACIAEHNPPEAEDAYSYRIIKTSVKDGLQKKVCVGCIQCGACMIACPSGAIYREEEYDIVLVDQEKCIGCRTCESVCPNQAIRYNAHGKMEKCDGCIERLRQGREPACVRVCCAKALTIE